MVELVADDVRKDCWAEQPVDHVDIALLEESAFSLLKIPSLAIRGLLGRLRKGGREAASATGGPTCEVRVYSPLACMRLRISDDEVSSVTTVAAFVLRSSAKFGGKFGGV